MAPYFNWNTTVSGMYLNERHLMDCIFINAFYISLYCTCIVSSTLGHCDKPIKSLKKIPKKVFIIIDYDGFSNHCLVPLFCFS